MTGQHDRQDESLTGQIHNQSGHCPFTGRYFEPCEGGGVNCGSGGVLCSSCGVVGGGVPFGSTACSVLVFVGGVGGGEKEAEAAVELEASSSVTVAGGDFEALGAFEEVAFPLPPDLPLAKGPFCLIPLMGQ